MFKFLIPYLEIALPVSVLIVLLLMAKPMFDRRYAAKTCYYIWLILALRLLVPFDIALPAGVQKPVQIDVADRVIYQTEPVMPTGGQLVYTPNLPAQAETNENTTEHTQPAPVAPPSPAPQARTITTAHILSYIWVGGSVLLVMYFTLQYILTSRQLRRNSQPDCKSQSLMADIRRQLGIDKKLAVYRCSSITSPVIVGLTDSRIYLPDFEIEEDLLTMMLYHELVHYKRRDIGYKLLMLAACCVHWFNPVVWMMAKQAGRDVEVSCDDEVVKNKDKDFRRLYSDSIMSVVKAGRHRGPVLSTGFADDKKTLVTRFKNIYDSTVKKGGKPVVATALAVSILSSALVACNTGENAGTTPPEDKAVPQQAMELMETFSCITSSDDFFNGEKYHRGFCYLLKNDLLTEKHNGYDKSTGQLYAYHVKHNDMMDAYQFMLADKLPADRWVSEDKNSPYSFALEYVTYNATLQTLDVTYEGDNLLTVNADRYYDGELYDNVTFVLEKQVVDYVPMDLQSKFKVGDEVWRIKDLECTVIEKIHKERIVEISSEEDFLNFVEDYNKMGYYREGYTYVLTDDIDFEGMTIPVVGTLPDKEVAGNHTNYGGFSSVFDGQGHTLKNFKIEPVSEDGLSRGGLFVRISPIGKVCNLNIENAVAGSPEDKTRLNNIGLLAGDCSGTVDNCHVSGHVYGAQAVGGFAGHTGMDARITNCSADVVVDGYREVGGFIGCVGYRATVDNCTSYGKAIGRPDKGYYNYSFTEKVWRVGGFAGSVISGTVTNCHSEVKLEILDTARNVGAFSATCESAVMTGCTYSKSKAGNWEPVDYVSNSDLYPADVKAVK